MSEMMAHIAEADRSVLSRTMVEGQYFSNDKEDNDPICSNTDSDSDGGDDVHYIVHNTPDSVEPSRSIKSGAREAEVLT